MSPVNDSSIAVREKTPLHVTERGISLTTFDELWRFSGAVQKSGLAPKGLQTQEAIFVALEMGLEVGLPAMAALQNIAVINGRPSIWGDAQLAVCRGTGDMEEFEEWYESKGQRLPRNPATFSDDITAVCRVKRRGMSPQEQGFSVADAKVADLWGKVGPWKQYPARMLRMRARSFVLRDQFGDALKGLRTAEEEIGATIDIETATPRRRRVATEIAEAHPAQEAVTVEAVSSASPDDVPMNYPRETPEHGRLSALMDKHQASFDQVRERLRVLKWADDSADAWDGVLSIPPAICLRICNAEGSFFSGIAKPEAA